MSEGGARPNPGTNCMEISPASGQKKRSPESKISIKFKGKAPSFFEESRIGTLDGRTSGWIEKRK